MKFNKVFPTIGQDQHLESPPTPAQGQEAILVSLRGGDSVFVQVPQNCHIKSAVIGAAAMLNRAVICYSIVGILKVI